MKIRILALTTALTMVGGLRAADTVELTDIQDKVSYSIGMNLGLQFKRDAVNINPDLLAKGMQDTLKGDPQLTETEMRSVLQAYQAEHQKKMQQARKEQSEENSAASKAFLNENANKPGVKTTASGLQYKVLTSGEGESPKATDTVSVHYTGTLIDGTKFDSSVDRGQPAEFAVNRVIKGWTEGLQMMKPGDKWQLFIPSELGYGERGSGRTIGPNQALIFDVELLSVKPAATPAPKSNVVTSDIIKVPSKAELEKGAKIEVIKKEDLEKLQQEQKQGNTDNDK